MVLIKIKSFGEKKLLKHFYDSLKSQKVQGNDVLTMKIVSLESSYSVL